MGNCRSNLRHSPSYHKFLSLRIASIYANIDESINKTRKINTLVEYFLKDYYGYKLDVLCIQGIKSPKILKEIIKTFKIRIEEYNEDNYNKNLNYETGIYLDYYPRLQFDSDDDDSTDGYENPYSTTEHDDNLSLFFNKLVITRHQILNAYDENFENTNNLSNNNLQLNNNDSDNIAVNSNYIQVVNLNIDNNLVSIYNLELQEDNIGINNSTQRKKQLKELEYTIKGNHTRTKSEEGLRMFRYGDKFYVVNHKGIHIITGMFHINELKNNKINPEYIRTMKILNALDFHKWINNLKKNNDGHSTNIRNSKDSYILLSSRDIFRETRQNKKSTELFKKHNLVITNACIMKNQVDMNQFINYPLDVLIMMFKSEPKEYKHDDERTYRKSYYGSSPNNNNYTNKSLSANNMSTEKKSFIKNNSFQLNINSQFSDATNSENDVPRLYKSLTIDTNKIKSLDINEMSKPKFFDKIADEKNIYPLNSKKNKDKNVSNLRDKKFSFNSSSISNSSTPKNMFSNKNDEHIILKERDVSNATNELFKDDSSDDNAYEEIQQYKNNEKQKDKNIEIVKLYKKN
jgi:hypothetical protein